jgi:N-dimethylarginine dimethylaminohydrolase
MSLSFKEYMIIAAAFKENQLDENALVQGVKDWLKKKLGKEPSGEEIEDQLKELDKNREKNLASIRQTQPFKDAEARKAERKKKEMSGSTFGTRPTVGTSASASQLKPGTELRAGESRHSEKSWRGEGKKVAGQVLAEGKKLDFDICYELSDGRKKKVVMRGTDRHEVFREFNNKFYRAKIVSIELAKNQLQRQSKRQPLPDEEFEDKN